MKTLEGKLDEERKKQQTVLDKQKQLIDSKEKELKKREDTVTAGQKQMEQEKKLYEAQGSKSKEFEKQLKTLKDKEAMIERRRSNQKTRRRYIWKS